MACQDCRPLKGMCLGKYPGKLYDNNLRLTCYNNPLQSSITLCYCSCSHYFLWRSAQCILVNFLECMYSNMTQYCCLSSPSYSLLSNQPAGLDSCFLAYSPQIPSIPSCPLLSSTFLIHSVCLWSTPESIAICLNQFFDLISIFHIFQHNHLTPPPFSDIWFQRLCFIAALVFLFKFSHSCAGQSHL